MYVEAFVHSGRNNEPRIRTGGVGPFYPLESVSFIGQGPRALGVRGSERKAPTLEDLPSFRSEPSSL